MRNALDLIPPQGLDWSCGINSAAKAINMFGYTISKGFYLNTFLKNAPKSLNKEAMVKKGIKTGSTGGAVFGVSMLLAPFTGGASVGIGLAGSGVAAIGSGIALAGDLSPSDIGPKPRTLAKYITGYLPGTRRALYNSYDDFGECAKNIRDDLRRGDPVIVFWSFAAHYVNVVGVSVDNDDLPEEFVIMETTNRLHKLNWQDMRFLMKREFASYSVLAGMKKDYHMVRFDR